MPGFLPFMPEHGLTKLDGAISVGLAARLWINFPLAAMAGGIKECKWHTRRDNTNTSGREK